MAAQLRPHFSSVIVYLEPDLHQSILFRFLVIGAETTGHYFRIGIKLTGPTSRLNSGRSSPLQELGTPAVIS